MVPMSIPRSCRGFSLLELVVTVAILGIAGAITLPTLFSPREDEKLNNASKAIVAWLDDLRRQAMQTSVPCTATWDTSTGTLSGQCGDNASSTLKINHEIYGGIQDISITIESVQDTDVDPNANKTKWIFTPKGTSTTQREARLTLGNNSEQGRCIQLTSPIGFVKAAKLTSGVCDYTSIY